MEEVFEDNKATQYKFRALKVYSSTEWLADNKKKYRKVFERINTSYIYAELSLYNTKFDQEDWDVNIELKCFQINKGKKELCTLPFKRKVSKFDNVMYIREGWGNKQKGLFWKKGTYFWEAWVEGKKVATKYFHVEDALKNELQNAHFPYLSTQSLKLYEGPYDDVEEEERVYYTAFNSEESKYIYSEIMLKNLNQKQAWHCELFIKFYNDARELKGQIVRLHRIEKGEELIKFTAGWGSNMKGSWRKDNYSVEIIFMEKLLAAIPFTVQDQFVEGLPQINFPQNKIALKSLSIPNDDSTFEEVLEELDNLIGLTEIKNKVNEHAQYLRFLKLRRDKGFEEFDELNIHSVFSGNPGTGKTTVARKMGKLYLKMGLLSKGHVHEVDRSDLVGEYIGQTAPKVKDAIAKARGGVLFIDEAYALARSNDDSKDFGREVIEILMKEMSNGEGDLAVIVAGYPKEMEYFLKSNPGLKSRFKHRFEFVDYLPSELIEISKYAAKEHDVFMEESASEKLNEYIISAFRDRDNSFGNARFVYDLIESAKINMGLRVMKTKNPKALSKKEISRITYADIENIQIKRNKILPNLPIDEGLLEDSINEMNAMIGIKNIKKEITEMVQLVRFHKENGKNILATFSLHTVLLGNPGTGKTTIARILTKIYKALGLLERGHIVETDRQGLVAGFVGQTALKTKEKIDEAKGGVLFIDEAYGLSPQGMSANGDFGNEAIQTLLKTMEDDRGEFFLFVAGYTEKMDNFLKINPGFKSRFDKSLKFEDYTAEELMLIAISMLNDKSMIISTAAKEKLQKYLEFIYEMRDAYFGNARTIRSLINDIIAQHNLRLAKIPLKKRKKSKNNKIVLKDLEQLSFKKEDLVYQRKMIGFK